MAIEKPLQDVFTLTGTNIPKVVDLRYLEAPEPMEKILMAGAQLGPDDSFVARLPHVPHPLFPHLEARGLDWQIHEEADDSVLILIRKQV